jgi:hypothetical protein
MADQQFRKGFGRFRRAALACSRRSINILCPTAWSGVH